MAGQRKEKPITLFIGIGLLVLAVIMTGSTFGSLIQGNAHEEQFASPGLYQKKIHEAGRYYLWHHYKTVFEEQSFKRERKLPSELKITLRNTTGTELKLEPDNNQSWSIGNHAKTSIGYIDLSGSQTIEIQTEDGADSIVILSFAKSEMKKELWIAFRRLALAGVSTLLGVPLLIWGFISWVRS